MGSKREEERNEKIIRGLMKLPPNRRCINCNSLGPQYVCTNFWTFVCMTCSGIHREFTHRVKSVSMAKFTTQEVDALQKGGNQRARELYLKAWDPQRQRLPDNSNVDKVRELIKNVYVDKKYAVEKSSDRPPKDPQSLRSHEDETRRASSYHSYSQSPPYDFQYEERRYGKHAPSLTRKGSDRGIYEGKLSNFLSPPSRFSDHANDDRFANEGSRASDYSVSSGGGDPFRSDVLSPSSQRDVWSPFGETSRDISSEIQGHQTNINNLQSFKSVNSIKLQEVASHPELSTEPSHDKTSSVPSPAKSSPFNGLDLFDAPFAPQTVTSVPTNLSNSKLPEPSSDQSVDLFQKSPVSSVPTFNEQKPSQTRVPSALDLFTVVSQQQPVASSNVKTSDVATPNDGGWATFDMPQKVGPENSATSTVSSSGGNILGNFNPFSFDQSSSHQNSVSHEPSASTHTFWHDGLQNVETATNNTQSSSHQNSISHEPSASTHTFWHDGLQNVETTTNNTQSWNAFEDSAGQQPIQNVPNSAKQAAAHSTSNANKSLGLGLYEAFASDGNVRIPDEREPPPSMQLHDFSMNPAVAGVHSLATEHKAINPFDIPFDSDMESSNMSQFWDMSSLQTALPNNQALPPYVGGANQSWFPQNPVPSYVPGGVSFDSPTGSLGFISGQAPSTQIPNVPAQGSVASIGGNPFA